MYLQQNSCQMIPTDRSKTSELKELYCGVRQRVAILAGTKLLILAICSSLLCDNEQGQLVLSPEIFVGFQLSTGWRART